MFVLEKFCQVASPESVCLFLGSSCSVCGEGLMTKGQQDMRNIIMLDILGYHQH